MTAILTLIFIFGPAVTWFFAGRGMLNFLDDTLGVPQNVSIGITIAVFIIVNVFFYGWFLL